MKAAILSSVLLPLLAAASSSGYGIMSARSASPIHLLEMTAEGGSFYLGGKTSSYCPDVGAPCPPGDETVLVPSGDGLDVVVPGGQRIYISPTGALSFTQAHSAYIPPGSVDGEFSITPGSNGGPGSYKTTAWGSSGFMACPAEGNKWQVFVAAQNVTAPQGNVGECLGFDAMAYEYNGEGAAAWQYI